MPLDKNGYLGIYSLLTRVSNTVKHREEASRGAKGGEWVGKLPGVKRPTSRDVARLAGVSHTTVSFVVNDVPHVNISEETRARVQRAIAQLDYHPHEGARSLSRKATRDLALVIPDAMNPHYLVIAEGIEAYAESRDYTVLVSSSGFDTERERRSLRWLKQRRVDALILCSTGASGWHEEARRLIAQGHVITTIGADIAGADVDTVGAVVGPGERLLLEHLIRLGHRRIGYVYGVFNYETYGGRLDVLLAIHRELGLPLAEGWVRRCGPTMEEGCRAARALLEACAGGERPTALIAVNDVLAGAVLSALHAAGIAVPDEMSVAGFDNTPQSLYTSPPLTTVDPDARAMGEHAARLTLERLADPGRSPVRVETAPRLVVRGSTARAPRSEGVP